MSRRVKGFVVSARHVANMCKKGGMSYQVVDGAPSTAKFENAMYDHGRSAFVIAMTDDSFDIVPEGSEMPIQFTKAVVLV